MKKRPMMKYEIEGYNTSLSKVLVQKCLSVPPSPAFRFASSTLSQWGEDAIVTMAGEGTYERRLIEQQNQCFVLNLLRCRTGRPQHYVFTTAL